jgi:TRAP-type uncharacterized transport system fused permease subunit
VEQFNSLATESLPLQKNQPMALAFLTGILTYLLPALVLYFAVRFIMHSYLKNEEMKRMAQKSLANNETIMPLKLQASERLVLLLERITPAQAVNRALQQGMNVYELQMILLKNIREEYEHNVAQQLYISPSCWSLIRTAKEEVIRLVIISASSLDKESGASEMARILIENWSALDQDPIQAAIDQVKREINS